jgi:hypothetical protein
VQMAPEEHSLVLPGVLHTVATPPSPSSPPHPTAMTSISAESTETHRIVCSLLLP